MSDMDRAGEWDRQILNSYVQSENTSIMLPSFNIPVNGVNTNYGQRLNDHIRSSFSVVGQNYAAVPGTSHQPFHHGSSLSYSSQLSLNSAQQGISHHNVPPIGGDSTAIQIHNPRGRYKRKQSARPLVFDEGSTSVSHRGGGSLGRNNYSGRSSSCPNNSHDGISLVFNNYTGGSSSNLSASAHCLPANYAPAPQIQIVPWDPSNGDPRSRNNVLPVASRSSQRNVRSRDCYAGSYPLSTPSRNPYPARHFSGAGPIWQPVQPVVPMAPHRMVFSAGTNTNNCVPEITAPNESNPTQTRNPSAFIPGNFAPRTRVSEANGNSSHHRLSSYVSHQTYPTSRTVATTLADRDQSGMESIPPFWYARRPLPPSLPIVARRSGNNSRNNRRTCPSVEDSAPVDDDSWISQGMIMNHMDDILEFLDPHRDMRLDIDSMSYEELLALEERIGNVSTGLSESKLSSCLAVRKYRSSEQSQNDRQDKKCAICLEEYEDGKKLGRLNCRHEFHLNCIKTWLKKKDICPYCKASALISATSKEKQMDSS